MGKAARWFRSLLGGGRKDQERQAASPAPSPAPAPADRKRWSFARSSRDSAAEGSVRGGGGGSAAIARAAEAAWLRSLDDDTGRRQSKHAIAVAAATAAAADAAVAAAQAAVEVVRLTSQGPVFGGGGAVMDPRGRAGAAVKIQTAFRGFLAKKALRALKALVRLQALVRGHLVRRQAAVTLQSMQALVRAQATVRAARCCRALPSLPPRLHHHPPARPRFSLQERHADDTRSEHGVAACGRRLSASVESASYDRSPKTVEMDTARPRLRAPYLSTEDEWCAQPVSSSPLPAPCQQQQHDHHLPPRIEVPTSRHFPDHDRCTPEKPRPATAQCTPRCAPPTPAKSVCGDPASYHGCLAASPGCPGYMSSTQSSEAKSSRSQSAPKQRPPEQQQPARKRVPLSEVVLQARASLGGAGVGTHKPCNARAQVPDAFDFRAAVVSRFEQRASEDAAAAAAERDRNVFFLQRRW